MSGLNLQAGPSDISTALIWRGVGLAAVTVPLTALAVSALDPKDIPQGAALNNMMRQLGGSVSLALVNTYLHTQNALHRSDLVSNITNYNQQAVERLNGYTSYFLSQGATNSEAKMKAFKLMDLVIDRQASLLSFGDAYILIGAVFLLALPLLLLAKQQKGKKAEVILSDH